MERKSLLAVAAGNSGKPLVARMRERFPEERFDMWLFLYGGAQYSEPEYSNCRKIKDAFSGKWGSAKLHMTPEATAPYDFIFFWDDDLDVGNSFNPDRYLEIARKYHVELSQPALTSDSYYSHAHTLQCSDSIGRWTDFVEIMAPVASRTAWAKWWNMFEPDYNHWGWGYDRLGTYGCGIERAAIIDAEPVRHTRPVSSAKNLRVLRDYARFLALNPALPLPAAPRVFGRLEAAPDAVWLKERRAQARAYAARNLNPWRHMQRWWHWLKVERAAAAGA